SRRLPAPSPRIRRRSTGTGWRSAAAARRWSAAVRSAWRARRGGEWGAIIALFLSPETSMAKAKRMYGCTECGATFPKWAGQCGECGAWNSLTETLLEAGAATPSGRGGWAGQQAQIKTLAEVS